MKEETIKLDKILEDCSDNVKNAVKELFVFQKKELLKKIEELKKSEVKSKNWIREDRVIRIYNQALEDIKKQLTISRLKEVPKKVKISIG